METQIKFGMGATIYLYSDSIPATVISVSKNKKSAEIQEDFATRTDSNGINDVQTYEYSPNPHGEIHKIRLTKNGWKIVGRKEYVKIGERRKYRDYSF